MQLDKLTVGGFLNFNDTATLDLRDLPAGLIAITGPNGHGKTRLLDSPLACIYGSFPSRGAEPLASYATSRTAEISTEWNIDGDVFRARRTVDGDRRASTAILERAGVALNDGKIGTFNDAAAKWFPSERQVLASAFAAQNRAGSFISLDQPSRMRLFSELCDLGHYAEKAETARRCVAIVERARAALLAARDLLARETSEWAGQALQDAASGLARSVEQATTQRANLALRVAHEDAERQRWVALAAEHLAWQAKVDALVTSQAVSRAELRRISVEGAAIETRAQEELVAAEHVAARTVADIASKANMLAAAHDRALQDLALRVANTRALVARREEITAAHGHVHAAEQALVELRRQEGETRDALERAKEAYREASTAVNTAALARTNLADRQRQVAVVDTVPCGGVGAYAACRFLTLAAEARAELPALEVVAATEPAQLAAANDARLVVMAWQETLAACLADLRAQESRRATHATVAALATPLAQATAELDGAQTQQAQAEAGFNARVADLDAQRHEAKVALATAQVAAETRRTTAQAELTARRIRVQDALLVQETQHTAAVNERERTAQASLHLSTAEQALASLRAEQTATEATLARLEAERAELARRQAAFDAKRQQHAEVTNRLTVADAELLGWSLLARACGRDGLPKLEVDAAGPTVSQLANDLLAVGYGTRFTLEVVTQVATADGKGQKERFDILVLDNQHGGEARGIGDLSGGERVVVEEALRGAIALWVNSRNRQPIRTCWRDETTGALDPANVPRYVAMLRRIQQLGGFVHILFVTHNADAAALADAQVHVQAGQPTVVLPPYVEAW